MLSNRKNSAAGISVEESNYSEEGFESMSMSKSQVNVSLTHKLNKKDNVKEPILNKFKTTPIKEEEEKNTTKSHIRKGDEEDSDEDYSEDYT